MNMIDSVWEFIVDNRNLFNLMYDKIKIKGSDCGYIYKNKSQIDEYLIVGTKKGKPNFILFTKDTEDIISIMKNGVLIFEKEI